MRPLFWVLFVALVLMRLPSLAQPAGADQDLYAYVGETIARGGLPYRDAWDQKPPAIHYTYALLSRVWPYPSMVPAADLGVAVATALVLVAMGPHLGLAGAGEAAGAVLVGLGDPAFTRLGGIRVRAQCETFIALTIAVAVWLAVRRHAPGTVDARRDSPWPLVAAGAAVGLAATFKYNAAVYGLLVVAIVALDRTQCGPMRFTRVSRRDLACLSAGVALPILAMLTWFAAHGALADLYQATVAYNVEYSGETYADALAFPRYLLTFPIAHARVDGLWFAGGLGCLVLLGAGVRDGRLVVWPLWVAVACLSIAINGSRGLPQYFVQAQPALAMAAGVAAAWAWPRLRPAWRLPAVLAVLVALWRVAPFPKVLDYARHDVSYWRGELTRSDYLSRFGERNSGDKFSASAVRELGEFLSGATEPGDRVLVFGFSPGALVQAGRVSASRFFWSRPIIVEFAKTRPGYGPAGLLADCEKTTPALVVLQRRDWDPDTVDSATYLLAEPRLRAWLDAHYRQTLTLGNYLIYERAAEAPHGD
ncbi:MAG: hypothetical protein U0Q12_06545 [Vicinamibacterales bacterium]